MSSYVTVSFAVPELPLCFSSPPYFAVTVTLVGDGGAVYVVVHCLWVALIGVQEVLEKLPPETLAVHVTVPVGAVADPALVSVMVAIRGILLP